MPYLGARSFSNTLLLKEVVVTVNLGWADWECVHCPFNYNHMQKCSCNNYSTDNPRNIEIIPIAISNCHVLLTALDTNVLPTSPIVKL